MVMTEGELSVNSYYHSMTHEKRVLGSSFDPVRVQHKISSVVNTRLGLCRVLQATCVPFLYGFGTKSKECVRRSLQFTHL